ncbi:endocuticle structural glycoprotein SgAbd-5-like [Colias croceus]|uniref:endocuticle structural glycoprotein SgAbd-5-like n=1 Tax=Colias crocea TaxID=72248 RepID=UPI001E28053C|nr:endocuticle structural glycoprotein SgAbd-5-like [Colias croceus]
MKLLIVLCIVVAAVSGAAVPSNDVQVLRYDNDNIGVGNYRYVFEQSDGSKHEQQGSLINEGHEDEAIAVKGSYSWVAPDGNTYIVTYIADSNGYKPTLTVQPEIREKGIPEGQALYSVAFIQSALG